MKWVEIITLRSPGRINRQLVDELLKRVPDPHAPTDTPHLVEIKLYHHSVFETDFSIHIYWRSEPGSQDKSALGLRFSSALSNLGLLTHSVWVETPTAEFPPYRGDARSQGKVASIGSTARTGRRGG